MPTTPPTEPQGGGGSALIASLVAVAVSIISLVGRLIPRLWGAKTKRKHDAAEESLGFQTLSSNVIQEQLDDKNRQLAETRQECKDLRAEVEELKDRNEKLRDKEIEQRGEIAQLKGVIDAFHIKVFGHDGPPSPKTGA